MKLVRQKTRLYGRIFYILFSFVLAALVVSTAAGHYLLHNLAVARLSRDFTARALQFAQDLPPDSLPQAALQQMLEKMSEERHVHAVVWSTEGQRLAFTNLDMPVPALPLQKSHFIKVRKGPGLAVPLQDGRCLVMRPRHRQKPQTFMYTMGALAGLLTLASYLAARLVTRRLEVLEAGVTRLGEGDLSARVTLRGNDELTSLAESFNQTASRLQNLVEAQRRMLASASHELRSPLTRLRLALELARDSEGSAKSRLDEAVEEIEELNDLVEELLLAGRLELQGPLRPTQQVDVAELLAEEAKKLGVTVTSVPAPLQINQRLLKVMLRNLLENACKHGQSGSAGAGAEVGVEVGVEPIPAPASGVKLWVSDRGPGVDVCERERIFEPFYRPAGHREDRDGGVGLGLYLVKRIAERHGGKVTCHPRENGGTVFTVTLFNPPPEV